MRNTLLLLTVLFLAATTGAGVKAQATGPDAQTYLHKISTDEQTISKNVWEYISAAAHSHAAKKIESKRKDMLTSISTMQQKVAAMPPFNGNTALRDSMVSFLKLTYIVLKEDYDKILNLEDIAEQSYDLMEAYMTAKEQANAKLDLAAKQFDEQYSLFAKQNNITLVDNTDKTAKHIETAAEVYDYYNKVYLIFFKSYKQELYVLNALDKGDVNAASQNIDALQSDVQEGLSKLDTIKSYKGDKSVVNACKELFNFYASEAKDKFPTMVDYHVKKDNFNKIEKTMKTKPESKRTKEDIDTYNKSVNEFNASVKQYNIVNQELNNRRNLLIDNWNKAVDSFLDRQVPKD